MNPTSYFNRGLKNGCSQGPNGIMKTFIIARHKRYNKNIYYRKAQNGHKHVTPPGSGHKNKPTPEGSHVSSIYYRKAQNGILGKLCRQGPNVTMKKCCRQGQ